MIRHHALAALCFGVAWAAASAIADTATVPSDAAAVHGIDNAARSPYAGEQTREIKSLSADDVAELRRGGGWGLARAAELNGMPGPIHLLELAAPLALSEFQVREISALYDAMRSEAVTAGERLIERETALEMLFREGGLDEATLRVALEAAGEARTALRQVHLSAHLATPALLSEAQLARYDELRGYGATDPCVAPSGHDESMWRKHNGCD